MKLPFCSVIIVNYNGKYLLKDCLNSVYILNYPKNRYEVILVDNGSADNSVSFVGKNFPHVKILKLDKNYGFAEGNNKGIEKARGDYITFLSNDTKVDKNWLLMLVKSAEKSKKIGICSSKVLDFKDMKTLQYAGGYLDILGSSYFRGMGEEDKGQYNKEEEVNSAFGCSMLIKREVINKLKYCFDPKFFLYYEETDLCWRTKLLGYKIIYVPKSIIFHKGGATSSKMKDESMFYLYRNKLWTFKKNLIFPFKQIILSFVVFRMFFTIIFRIIRGEWKYGFSIFKYLFTKTDSDVDLRKVSISQQLSMLSPPIFAKYTQFFRNRKK